jgi:Family of unknown function (DUF6812)
LLKPLQIVIHTGQGKHTPPLQKKGVRRDKMYPPFENKGKIFTDVVRTQKACVVIQTTMNTTIHGILHIRLDNRLKDELNTDEPFIAITDAIILDSQGTEMYKADFLAVNRSQIVYLFPVNKREETGSDS